MSRTTLDTSPDPPRTRSRWPCRSRRPPIPTLVAALVLTACGTTDPIEDRRVGVIRELDGVPDVTVPASARASEPFSVRVVTMGGGCIRKDETEVVVEGRVATVTPYDLYGIPRPGLACLALGETIEHFVEVSFDTAGEARVVVRGRLPDSEETQELEYPLTVGP